MSITFPGIVGVAKGARLVIEQSSNMTTWNSGVTSFLNGAYPGSLLPIEAVTSEDRLFLHWRTVAGALLWSD